MSDTKNFEQLLEDCLQLVEERKFRAARQELLSVHPADIAEIITEIIDEVGLNEAVIMFRSLPKDTSVDVFSFLSSDDQKLIIDRITEREITDILEEMDFDDMIDVLEELPANVVDKILEKTTRQERKQINTFLNYKDNSAGSLMTPDYISLQRSMTVGDALDYIKEVGMDSETVYTCYVKEQGRKLYGIISLRTLVINDRETPIDDLIQTDFVSVNVDEDQEEVAEKFQKYGYLSLPVIDKEGRLVGIITMDDIFDVIEEETTEDVERMAGVSGSKGTEYLDIGVMKHVWNRFPWLLALMLSYIFTGAVISRYEDQLSTCIALVAYMPMLMGTGGNSGSQSAALIIRGLAVGDLAPKDFLRVLWKEIRVAVILGVLLSAVNFLRLYIFEDQTMAVTITVCLAMILIIIIAKSIGSMLPLLAKRIGIDPALMASPLIQSMTDLISVTTYFALATVFIGI